MSAPEKASLIDKLSLGVVMQTYPRKVIENILFRTGLNSVRRRLLPAFTIVYLVILISLYADVSIRENLRILLEGLRRRFGIRNVKIAVGSAISKARKRLGYRPYAELFRSIVKPISTAKLKGCFFHKWRIVTVDGSSAEVQNTPENRKFFGMHSNQFGESGYPLLKWVALSERGTHVIFSVNTGVVRNSEESLFYPLIPDLKPDMLLLADRRYYNFYHWKKCNERGCALLWRVNKNLKLRPLKSFDDGSYLSEVEPSDKLLRRGVNKKGEKMIVRVIEYQVIYEDGSESEVTRIITNILDPSEATAKELSQLYPARWDAESSFGELKTHLKGRTRVLRSQSPELVLQEFYGFLLGYFVVRKVMTDAAVKSELSPLELSFVHTVRVIKRKLSEFTPPYGGNGKF